MNNLNLPEEIKERIRLWLSEEFDEETRTEIQKLIDEKNEKELTERFYKNLEFGTGGLRGIMEAGTNRMNQYTVSMATQGLSNYILKQGVSNPSVVIAHDSRHNSDFFSEITALVLAGNGIKTYLFDGVRPTPELSFAVRELQTTSGIVITASHNPREYNGYKVYWDDGAQIVAPHDAGIINEVKKIKSIKDVKNMSKTEAENKGLLEYVGEEIDEKYLKNVQQLSINPDIIKQVQQDLKIVYTPLHGAGYKLVPTALKNYGFTNILLVKEQSVPDGNFPTVSYPNPEESEALSLSLKLAKSEDADIVLATDPDSDRLGIAVKIVKTNEFVLFNGNQLGSLLTYYILSQYKEKNQLPDNALIVKTIVTTDLVKNITDFFHVKLEEVLTGFKNIASVTRENEKLKEEGKSYYQYIFGFEESYGFLPGTFVRDKDGVSAACLTAELAAYAKSQNKTLLDLLDEVYEKFGFYWDKLKYLVFKGKEGHEKIEKIMNVLTNNPIEKIFDHQLNKMINFQTQKTYKMPEKIEEPFSYKIQTSNVLAFYFDDDIKILIRPSGTEPKIKYYFSIKRENKAHNLAQLKKETQAYLNKLEEEFTKYILSISE